MNKETRQFITENINADIHHLALQSARFPLVDMPLVIRQINGKQKIKSKVPLFYNTEDVLYPAQLSLEQSSSESTAKYKSTLCEGKTLTDLTGGFGVDCFFMSINFEDVSYVERQEELCVLTTHNFNILKRDHIRIINSDAEKYLSEMEHVDWIFIDPARRNSSGNKVVLLSDCEPDVSVLSTLLLEKASHVMLKLSPMMDITAAVRELPTTSEVHIVSTDNECKEILLILQQTAPKSLLIKAVNINKKNENQFFEYDLNEEINASASYTSNIERYLYEPNTSLMKSGAFKIICSRFDLYKLHNNTHLYTSTKLLLQFPGRIFEVKKMWGNSKNELKELTEKTPKANISTRNYPQTVDELRKKLKIKEGGDIYLFACTLVNEKKVILECKKC
ncbi:MAG: SAM-dependent methyltransferase [Paludibacter sp.]|nr:SAM-dependent methyltransferase [Paludibacter sp.]